MFPHTRIYEAGTTSYTECHQRSTHIHTSTSIYCVYMNYTCIINARQNTRTHTHIRECTFIFLPHIYIFVNLKPCPVATATAAASLDKNYGFSLSSNGVFIMYSPSSYLYICTLTQLKMHVSVPFLFQSAV